jgi:hypothetical protein
MQEKNSKAYATANHSADRSQAEEVFPLHGSADLFLLQLHPIAEISRWILLSFYAVFG